MPRPIIVSLPLDQTPIYADRCVVCGKSAPGNKHTESLSLDGEEGGPLKATVEVPCCRSCSRSLTVYWVSRALLFVVWFFVGGLPAWAVANLASPFFDALARQNSWYPLLILIPIAGLSWSGGFYLLILSCRIWPPGFAVFLNPTCIDYAFRNPALAAEFAQLNGTGKLGTG